MIGQTQLAAINRAEHGGEHERGPAGPARDPETLGGHDRGHGARGGPGHNDDLR